MKKPYLYRYRRIKHRRMLTPTQKLGAVLLLTGTVLLSLLILIYSALTPEIVRVAESTVEDNVTVMINDAVRQVIEANGIGYDDLVMLTKNSDGEVTALVTNVASINKLQADIATLLTNMMTESDTVTVRVPLGNIFKSGIFSGYGPDVPVKIVLLSSVFTDFENNFTDAGINQTRHQLMLKICTELELLVTGAREPVRVSDEIVIAETVIVGSVPESFANFQTKAGLP